MEEPTPTAWADDGTTWDEPEVVLSDGPQSVVLSPEDVEYLAPHLPTSGRVGFTVQPGPVRVTPADDPER